MFNPIKSCSNEKYETLSSLIIDMINELWLCYWLVCGNDGKKNYGKMKEILIQKHYSKFLFYELFRF